MTFKFPIADCCCDACGALKDAQTRAVVNLPHNYQIGGADYGYVYCPSNCGPTGSAMTSLDAPNGTYLLDPIAENPLACYVQLGCFFWHIVQFNASWGNNVDAPCTLQMNLSLFQAAGKWLGTACAVLSVYHNCGAFGTRYWGAAEGEAGQGQSPLTVTLADVCGQGPEGTVVFTW